MLNIYKLIENVKAEINMMPVDPIVIRQLTEALFMAGLCIVNHEDDFIDDYVHDVVDADGSMTRRVDINKLIYACIREGVKSNPSSVAVALYGKK